MFKYIYSKKNDGSPSPYSSEQAALSEALNAYYMSGGSPDWEAIEIKYLPCDKKEEHWPDVCWHYEVIILSY